MYWYVLDKLYVNFDVYIFFKFCCDFFSIFWALYIAFHASRPSRGRDAANDVERCPPSRRPRPRLWTMVWTQSRKVCSPNFLIALLLCHSFIHFRNQPQHQHTDLSHFLGETVISHRNTVVWIWFWKNLKLFGWTYNWQVASKSYMQQYQLPIAWYLPQWSIPLDSGSSLNLNMFGEENHSKNIVFPSGPKGIPKVTKNTVPD